MKTDVTTPSAFKFHILLLIASLPFWVLGAMADRQMDKLPINLPISSLMFICPLVIAMILTYRGAGTQGIKELVENTLDYKKPKLLWYIPAFLIMPVALYLSFIIMKLSGISLPRTEVQIFSIPILFVIFMISAFAEEAGWMTYLMEPMLQKYNGLTAAIIIGCSWGIWHIVPYLQANNDAWWILWQIVASIFNRIVMVWIYKNSNKGIFLAVIYHAMINVSTFAFPQYGSHYNPAIVSSILGILIIFILRLWGGRKLSKAKK